MLEIEQQLAGLYRTCSLITQNILSVSFCREITLYETFPFSQSSFM